MRLTILSVAFPFVPVGPDAVGGAEQVLSHLDGALVREGHRSIVVACEGSVVQGELVPTRVPRGDVDEGVRGGVWRQHRGNIEGALRRHAVDVIHLHGLDFPAYLPSPGRPALVTLHLPPSWYVPEAWAPTRPGTFLVCVSQAQHGACPPCPCLLPAIPNGVPVRELALPRREGGFALALGRICPEKNFHDALEAGRLAGVDVLLGGQVFPYEAHRRYFHERIEPLLDGARRYVGPVGFARKRVLLSSARCLLAPSLAPETSSLVAMEALACGTPVIAYPVGALPEIVDHGVTGFLVEGVEAMARAMGEVGRLDPEACRRAARGRFSLEDMVGKYIQVYRRLAKGREGG